MFNKKKKDKKEKIQKNYVSEVDLLLQSFNKETEPEKTIVKYTISSDKPSRLVPIKNISGQDTAVGNKTSKIRQDRLNAYRKTARR